MPTDNLQLDIPDIALPWPTWGQKIADALQAVDDGNVASPVAYGADSTGTSDSTTAIQDALDAAPVVAIWKPGTYLFSVLTMNDGQQFITGPGVTLKRIPSSGGDAIRVYDAEDVVLCLGIVDGDKANNVAGAGSQLIAMRGACKRVYVPRAYCKNAKGTTAEGGSGGDGIYIARGNGTAGTLNAIPEDIVIGSAVVCDGNVRQGMSITACRRMTVEDGATFCNTTGTDPGAGIDVEPGSATLDVIEDLYIGNVNLYGNHSGLLVNNNQQADIINLRLGKILAHDNSALGIQLLYAATGGPVFFDTLIAIDNGDDGVTITNDAGGKGHHGKIYSRGNGGLGVLLGSMRRFELVIDASLNGEHGIEVQYVSSGQMFGTIDAKVWNNGQDTPDTYNGVELTGNATHTDYSLTLHVDGGNLAAFGTVAQHHVVNISNNARQCEVHLRRCIGYDTGGMTGSKVNNGTTSTKIVDPYGGQTYTVTNLTTDRTFDADTVTVAELADIVGTLIADLKADGRGVA